VNENRDPFHAGEVALQWATGERAVAVRNGRWIGDAVVDNAVEFIGRQQLAIVATVNDGGRPWCSLLLGDRGTFRVLDPFTVVVDASAGIVGDGLVDRIGRDPRIGLLFLDVTTRRRYRVNGRVVSSRGHGLTVRVEEAYPNCPKYIQRRGLEVTPLRRSHLEPQDRGESLDDPARAVIGAADTFFVASATPAGNLDASHRGGRPGFVRLEGNRLWIPDYAGNGMYNTLGNLAAHPAAGLLFVDFASGTTLQLSGDAVIDLDVVDPRTGGTNRAWTFTTSAWTRSHVGAGLRSELLEASPHNP
jgi:uncharacterized protein